MARACFNTLATLVAATATQLSFFSYLTGAAPVNSANNGNNTAPVLPTFRVVNGQPVASASDVEWFAALTFIVPNSDGHTSFGQCGGSLIGSEWVLTAAHCLYDTDLGKYREPLLVPYNGDMVPNIQIQIGGLKSPFAGSRRSAGSDYELFYAVDVVGHPKYGGAFGYDSMVNDICLLRLDTPTSRTPVPLNIATDVHTHADVAALDGTAAVGRSTVAYGFGDTKYEGSGSDILLQSQPMSVVSLPQCQEAWAKVYYGAGYTRAQLQSTVKDLGNNIVCTDTTVSDICQGDSGGPLLDEQTGFQTGIVSFGEGCAS